MSGGNGREHADREALRERLSAYLDGELAPDDAAALERHLATCPECRDDLAGLREVRALLRALPSPALPRSFALPPSTAPQASRPPAVVRPLPDRSARAATSGRARPAPAAVPALARAAQWVGSLAAVFGLLLIVATAVLGGHPGAASTFSAAAPAGGSSHLPQGSQATQQRATTPAPQTPTRSSAVLGPGTPATTPAPTPYPSPTASFGPGISNSPAVPTATGSPLSASTAAEPFPVLPATGAGLFAGGIVLFGAGSVAARRRRRRAA